MFMCLLTNTITMKMHLVIWQINHKISREKKMMNNNQPYTVRISKKENRKKLEIRHPMKWVMIQKLNPITKRSGKFKK